jgi:hypothetical protein
MNRSGQAQSCVDKVGLAGFGMQDRGQGLRKLL